MAKRDGRECQTTYEAFLRVDSISALLFNLFMIAVLPAIGEGFSAD